MLLFFAGKMCNINIDECAINPCHNGGTCVDGVNGFTCLCREGFHDTTCQSQLNECLSNPCIHGHCEDKINGYGFYFNTYFSTGRPVRFHSKIHLDNLCNLSKPTKIFFVGKNDCK